MYSNIDEKYELDIKIINKLAKSWSNRVSVNQFKLGLDGFYVENMPDFPERLVPFSTHNWYNTLSTDKKKVLLAAAWISYNEKTIAVEDFIINPFCRHALRGNYLGTGNYNIHTILAQTIIDEQYHILMCLESCNVARNRYNISDLYFEKPFVVKRFESDISECKLKPKNIRMVYLAYATVAEMTINAYLSLLSSDYTIQPINRISVELHRRDESSHSIIFSQIIKSIYKYLDNEEKKIFVHFLNEAIKMFSHQDFTMWKCILEYLGCDCIDDIKKFISTSNVHFKRDFYSLKKLLNELGIVATMLDPLEK